MSQIIYFNGSYINKDEAKISIGDRGYIFGDGIYEVFLVKNGKLIDFDAHIERFVRSMKIMNFQLRELANLREITMELLKLNNKNDALMYLQISRGDCGVREHTMPLVENPTFFMMAGSERVHKKEWTEGGIKCNLESDTRWQRRDVKTLNLLGNIMAKQKSAHLGFDDAIFVDGGIVTEATSSNVLIVDADGTLKTHPATNKILDGITKNRTLEIAKSLGIKTKECAFTPEDMISASEIFLTSSGYKIRGVSQVDGHKIGNGVVGKTTKLLSEKMEEFIANHS